MTRRDLGERPTGETIVVDFKQILVAIDFGESSQQALELGIELALKFGGALTLVHAYEIPVYAYDGASYVSAAELLAPIEATARRKLQSTLETVQKRMPAASALLRVGVASAEILAAIEEARPDLLVVGTHGRHGLGRMLLGSVAEKLVRLSPVPVLTVRHRLSSPR
jgi:nucleotide-binding universal stress UspA family protein